MKIRKSGASLSRIVQIGQKLKRLTVETGQEYLPLNRGVNQVVPIDLNRVVPELNFNTDAMQVYPPSQGIYKLRQAINETYFCGHSTPDNILITCGGMNGLDLVVQTLDVGKLYLPAYYWGSYTHILKIRGMEAGSYLSQSDLPELLPELKRNAVLICDPGNPLGEKYDDDAQFELVKLLNDNGVVVVFDCPYRRMFADSEDGYYSRLMQLQNVVITESFSKSLGLSGQRLGFVHSTDTEFNEELHIRLMYCTNGINVFAQQLVHHLLTGETGRQVVREFKERTVSEIEKNVNYLRDRGLLAIEFYENAVPHGLFAVINLSEDELLKYRIGSVSLSFFTKTAPEYTSRFARISVSVPHDRFVRYFSQILSK